MGTMLYSSAGFLALIIHIIINHDVLRGKPKDKLIPAHRAYRAFLFATTLYYITDILWGMLYERKLIALTYADTVVYFAAMAFSILFWTRYVVAYLKEKNRFTTLLMGAGWLLFAAQIVVLIVNLFRPILFTFDADGAYSALTARYSLLFAQIGLFGVTAMYALIMALRGKGTGRLRHRTIGLSSLAMAGFISAQAYFPLLPLYAIGCLLSSCVLHSFVLENEREEYRDGLEEQLRDSILKGNYYDLLTGLSGMTHFFEVARQKRAELVKAGGRPAFLYLNLSGLKFYNQRHGFSEGDRLLRGFSQLLTAAFGSENCSRFGQDHFAVFAEAEGLEDKLRALFERWSAENGEDCPAILAGIYSDSAENVDVSTACDLARIACDEPGHSYVSSIHYYDTAMLCRAEREQYIISHLDQALEKRWVQVYYQPIVRASNGRVCDEEALARWIDPVRGFLSPADFVPILEEAKLIYKLDLYVVDRVLEKLKRQRDAGLHIVPQSVNLSRSDFDACDIVSQIVGRVDGAGFAHSVLTIEITESTVGGDFDFIRRQALRFRELGFPVWMDDFGSGYSSLDVLQSMPVDLIKFDMRFMQQFDHGDKSRIILTELMKMAIGMGIDTVCEGVEREDQVAFLREIGCSKLQGYFFTKPLPMDEILERYETGRQIGFENPREAAYYDSIGRINLYDLAVLSKEGDDSLQHYFSTVPMAIIEVQGGGSRFTRSNQAFRDFMRRYFDAALSGSDNAFVQPPEGAGRTFVRALRDYCGREGRVVFDEILPDGSVAHVFLRHIAQNPVTGTTAAAVAILAIAPARLGV